MNQLFKYVILTLSISGYYNYQIRAAHTTSSTPQTELLNQWFDAAKNGNLEKLQELVEKVQDFRKFYLGARDINNYSALDLAASNGHENIVKFILEIPNTIKYQEHKQDALNLATQHGHLNVIKLLLKKYDIDINWYDDDDESTALILAAQKGHTDIVKLFLSKRKKSINIKWQQKDGNNALMMAIKNRHNDIVELLLHFRSSNWSEEDTSLMVNARNGDDKTALMLASDTANIHAIQLLLKITKIDVNARHGAHGIDTLQYAFLSWETSEDDDERNRHNAIIRLLAQHPDTKINAKNNFDETILDYAVGHGHSDFVEFLLEIPNIIINDAQTKPMDPDYDKEAPKLVKKKRDLLILKAFQAIKLRDLETLKSITAQIGIDSIIDSEGNTLLDAAFKVNNREIIEFLLKHAKNAKKLLVRFPFEFISPASDLFRYFIDLAYGIEPTVITPEISKKRKREDTEINTSCANCKTSNCTKRCSACKAVYYCSDVCQKSDWKAHKEQCKNLC